MFQKPRMLHSLSRPYAHRDQYVVTICLSSIYRAPVLCRKGQVYIVKILLPPDSAIIFSELNDIFQFRRSHDELQGSTKTPCKGGPKAQILQHSHSRTQPSKLRENSDNQQQTYQPACPFCCRNCGATYRTALKKSIYRRLITTMTNTLSQTVVK